MFLLYSGSTLHGGVGREGHRQQDGILLPTFFSTFLKAEKASAEGDVTGGSKPTKKKNRKSKQQDAEKGQRNKRKRKDKQKESKGDEGSDEKSDAATAKENLGFEESEL